MKLFENHIYSIGPNNEQWGCTRVGRGMATLLPLTNFIGRDGKQRSRCDVRYGDALLWRKGMKPSEFLLWCDGGGRGTPSPYRFGSVRHLGAPVDEEAA